MKLNPELYVGRQAALVPDPIGSLGGKARAAVSPTSDVLAVLKVGAAPVKEDRPLSMMQDSKSCGPAGPCGSNKGGASVTSVLRDIDKPTSGMSKAVTLSAGTMDVVLVLALLLGFKVAVDRLL